MKYKAGDIVICKLGFNQSDIGRTQNNDKAGGAGYSPGLQFIIEGVTEGVEVDGVTHRILWSKNAGIWDQAVEYVDDLTLVSLKIKEEIGLC